jgi:hypothetical protein
MLTLFWCLISSCYWEEGLKHRQVIYISIWARQQQQEKTEAEEVPWCLKGGVCWTNNCILELFALCFVVVCIYCIG